MNKLQKNIKYIFNKENIDGIIAYRKSSQPLISVPFIVTKIEEINKIVFDISCHNNLAKVLLNLTKQNPGKKYGIITKACDARSIVHLIKEQQLNKDQTVIIGISCKGVIDPNKLRKITYNKRINDININEKEITIIENKNNIKISLDDVISESCISCQYPNSSVYDYFIGEGGKSQNSLKIPDKIEKLKEKTSAERWEYFKNEFSKCIRCNACRNSCPMCYCTECFADKTNPAWIGKGNDLSDIMIFHIMRSIHMAGRCTSCGACSRACPFGIDLSSLNFRLVEELQQRFNAAPGIDLDSKPILNEYNINDKDEFII